MSAQSKTSVKNLITNTIEDGGSNTAEEVRDALFAIIDSSRFILDISDDGERVNGTTLSITKETTIFYGSSAATATLPTGAVSILYKRYLFANDGTANVTISGDGSDAISNTDPFISYPGTRHFFVWDGSNWVVTG